jgi:branched-chain amino acid transport system substrate-binding protein
MRIMRMILTYSDLEDPMDWISFRRPRRRALLAVLSAGALMTMAACGSDAGGTTGGKGLPDTIKIVATNPTSGPAAFAGESANKGYKLAVKEINASDLLGGSKLEVSFEDTKGEAQTAAQETSQAIASKDVVALFGSVLSSDAVVMSPLVQKQGLPTVYTQAGSAGVVVGNFTYRATPLMSTYYPVAEKWLTDGGYKSMGIIYTQATPTLVEVGGKTLPALAKDLGIDVVASIATPATTQDFSSAIQQVLNKKPDLVSVLQVGAANVTAMKQLRQAGYTGAVLGNSGASGGNLTPAGTDGKGMVWPTDFDHAQAAPSSQKFVTAYKAEYNDDPLNYAAEAYDAAYFLARSIAAAGSTTRSKIADAMAEEAAKPMDGALGGGLTWSDGTIKVPGVMIEWDGTKGVLLYEASK